MLNDRQLKQVRYCKKLAQLELAKIPFNERHLQQDNVNKLLKVDYLVDEVINWHTFKSPDVSKEYLKELREICFWFGWGDELWKVK